MTCGQVTAMLSAYLDGAVTGRQMYSLDQHLRNCGDCKAEYDSLRRTQALLSAVGKAKAPEDLSLKLRLAISHEAARVRQPLWGSFGLRMQNALKAFMVPATAGIFATIVIFGLLMGFISPVQANTNDVPLLISTDPELEQGAFDMTLSEAGPDSLIIEAYINTDGRVENYRILSDQDQSKELPSQVKSMLIYSRFRPATWMGSPRPGTAVLSFSRISVKG
jgi:hypothetical protein